MKRKKHIYRILGMLAGIGLLWLPLDASAAETLELRIQAPAEVKPEETFDVAVKVEGDALAAMAQFDLTYDSEKLSLLDVQSESRLKGTPMFNQAIEGHIYFAWDNVTAVEAEGNWLYCTFRAEREGTAWISVAQSDYLLFGDADMNTYQVNVTDAAVTVTQEAAEDRENPVSKPQKTGSNDGITLNKNTESIKKGDSLQLKADADTEAVIWESSNDSVATVDKGKVTAHGPGTAEIMVISEDGTRSASCVITVEDGGDGETQTRNSRILGVGIVAIAVLIICFGIHRKRKKTGGRSEHE